MGKNNVLNSLSSLLANTIVHKILIGKTSKPESTSHLEFEEIEYRSQAIKKSRLYNWNDKDVSILKGEITKKIENKFKNKYIDVKVSEDMIRRLIDEEIALLLKR